MNLKYNIINLIKTKILTKKQLISFKSALFIDFLLFFLSDKKRILLLLLNSLFIKII